MDFDPNVNRIFFRFVFNAEIIREKSLLCESVLSTLNCKLICAGMVLAEMFLLTFFVLNAIKYVMPNVFRQIVSFKKVLCSIILFRNILIEMFIVTKFGKTFHAVVLKLFMCRNVLN